MAEVATFCLGSSIFMPTSTIGACGRHGADSCALGRRDPVPAHLNIFLAEGVTSLQLMHGAPEMLAAPRSHFGRRGDRPRLVVGSPRLDGLRRLTRLCGLLSPGPRARLSSIEMKAAGYDFIKIYDGLNAETSPPWCPAP